ncbi:MAG: hypothetical protein IJA86_01060 [Clostridia bacterium]|nr:hypothetical protein [Clostridia bacterium]
MNTDKKQTASETETKLNTLEKSDISVEMTNEEKINSAAARILELYRPAFEELAK